MGSDQVEAKTSSSQRRSSSVSGYETLTLRALALGVLTIAFPCRLSSLCPSSKF